MLELISLPSQDCCDEYINRLTQVVEQLETIIAIQTEVINKK